MSPVGEATGLETVGLLRLAGGAQLYEYGPDVPLAVAVIVVDDPLQIVTPADILTVGKPVFETFAMFVCAHPLLSVAVIV